MKYAFLFLLLLLAGCGGGDSAVPESTGRMTFRIAWPASSSTSRLVPTASQSIEIRVLNGQKVVATKVLARPATEVTIEKLPAKKLVNLVRAFPNADATGVAQAQVQAQVEIKADETVEVRLTMNSTIDRLEPSVTGLVELDLTETATLSATPRNAAGEAVIIKPDALRWTSSAPNVASVTDAGVVTGVAAGVATITVTEPESGKNVTFLVAVGPIGRLVYSQIAANIRGDQFPQDGPGTFSEFIEDDLPPLYTYDFSGTVPGSTAVNTRDCLISLSRDIPVGTRVAVLGGAVGNPIAEVVIAETENEYNAQGDIVRYRERAFQGIPGGHVTLVKVEGDTRTVHVENVKMQAVTKIFGGDDLGTPVSIEGSGTFVVNGIVTFKANR